MPPREDPRDVLVARDGLSLGELPDGSRVGTGSPRRAAQLRALGYGLEVVEVRGNVDTRLRLVDDGVVDAVVLARAGLARLGRLDAITEVIDPLQMLPAPGQGALAIECRAPDNPENAAIAACSRCSTMPRPGSPSPPSARCSPRWKPAARPLLGPTEKQPKASMSLSCTCEPSSVLSTARQVCGCPRPDLSTRLHGSAATSRLTCSPRVRLI